MLNDVALVLRRRPTRLDGNNVTCAKGNVGIMDEVVFRVGEELVDSFVPFLAAYTDLNGLVHESGRDNDAVKLVSDATGGFSDW